MKKINLMATFFTISFIATGLFGQTPAGGDVKKSPIPSAGVKTPSMVLEFFEDDQQLKIYNSEGFEYGSVYLGMELLEGDRIKTAKSSAELRLIPNNSIFKIGPNTNFQIKALKPAGGGINEFTILEGKIRTVAAKVGGGTTYRFTTPTAVGGIRGTDFGMEVSPGKIDKLVVREGAVDFTQVASGKTLSLTDGMFADTFATSFAGQSMTTQGLSDFFSNLNFVVLNPGQVPGQQPSPSATPAATPEPKASGNAVPVASAEPSPSPASDGQKASDQGPNPALDAIKKILGIEIGTLMIDGVTHGKLIVQPKIVEPDFKIVFYLPIVYKNDLFNAGDWYRPNGNNEWSFGTDQASGDTSGIILDIMRDLVLKIKFVEIAKQGDPFFLKIGSIPSMTLGHGFLIGGYANDGDFPAVRRLGVDMGIDGGTVAFETLVNDLAQPEIFGARFLWRPAYPAFKIGAALSLAADINPLASLSGVGSNAQQSSDIQQAKLIKPMLFSLGIDLDLPIIEDSFFSIKAYGDFGGMVPYFSQAFQRAYDGTTVSAGFQWGHFFTLNTYPAIGIGFKNYGIQTGLMGNIAFFDYKLEYQYYDGTFQPNFMDQPYDRTRGLRALNLISEFNYPLSSEEGIIKMGIFGKLGANILETAYVSLGYKWPWTISDLSGVNYHNPDFFTASLSFTKDKLPYGIGFSISYERTYFLNMLTQPGSFNFLDQYSVFKASIEVPVGTFFNLHVAVSTSARRDANGNIDMSSGHPVMAPTLIIESVF